MLYIDVVGIVVAIIFHYWQISTGSSNNRRWYREGRKRLAATSWIPPGRIFGVVWTLLYGLLSAAAVIYFYNDEDGEYNVPIFVLWVVNMMLNKVWSLVFFDMGRVGWALAIALVMLATSIAILVLVGISAQWLAFGLYFPYPVWILVAIYLNAKWFQYGLPTR